MKTTVMCFASAKGGSGKTVISASLARCLAGLGRKVLLVDTDAATNGLSLFYLEELNRAKKSDEEDPRGIFEATEDTLPTVFSIDKGVDMIPSVYVMKNTEGISPDFFRRSISETLGAFRGKYDHIILDAQAGTDIYAQIAMEGADGTVIVTEYDPVSAEGVERLKHLLPTALPPNKTWILFNKILPEFAQSLGEFLAVARYLNPLPWDAEVMRAFARRSLAVDMETGNDYTVAIMRTALSLLGKDIEEEIDHWKQEREEFFRAPARSQLESTEQELSMMERLAVQTDYKLEQSRRKMSELRFLFIYAAAITVGVLVYITVWTDLENMLIPLLAATLGSVGLGLYYYLSGIYKRGVDKEMIDLEGQKRVIALKLDDLKERRKRYRVILESDLDVLFKQKG